MKAIELSLYFDDYERCSFDGAVVSFTDTDGHTLSLPVHTLTHMYNFAQFELARRDKSDSQPEALRIADELDRQFPLGASQNFLCGEAAAELRRLHAQAAQDEALLRQALEALEVYAEYDPEGGGVADNAIAAIKERLGVSND